jgi:hypothetical protein
MELREDGMVWIGLIWLRIGISGGLLWTVKWTLEFLSPWANIGFSNGFSSLWLVGSSLNWVISFVEVACSGYALPSRSVWTKHHVPHWSLYDLLTLYSSSELIWHCFNVRFSVPLSGKHTRCLTDSTRDWRTSVSTWRALHEMASACVTLLCASVLVWQSVVGVKLANFVNIPGFIGWQSLNFCLFINVNNIGRTAALYLQRNHEH